MARTTHQQAEDRAFILAWERYLQTGSDGGYTKRRLPKPKTDYQKARCGLDSEFRRNVLGRGE